MTTTRRRSIAAGRRVQLRCSKIDKAGERGRKRPSDVPPFLKLGQRTNPRRFNTHLRQRSGKRRRY